MLDLIQKKRDGGELTQQEIEFMIKGYTDGQIPDYQMSAFCMAVFFRNMSIAERVNLTMAMVHSGDCIDLSNNGIKVDKHSTGGVGDTTTLVLAPLVASLGLPVAKMSGRGLGHTGGTIDKLESIPGFHVEIDNNQFIELVNRNGIAVIGQTGNLTPADKKLYALRDVTATVESIPLIASSIMSKKLAAGADAIVLDVKLGSGAFMKSIEDAKELARAMVDIGNGAGRKTMAVISAMNQPLGRAVGNALEVREAIDTLKGNGPKDLYELCLTLGSKMVYLAHKAENQGEARKLLEDAIKNGLALHTFKTFVAAQGGDDTVVEHPELLPRANYVVEVPANRDGYVADIIADHIGVAAMLLGAGRVTKDSPIDLAVGLVLHKKVGDKVQKGESLLSIHSNKLDISEIKAMVYEAYTIVPNEIAKPRLIYDEIG
jgi:pyrimidine-nucleoside phosphorylase